MQADTKRRLLRTLGAGHGRPARGEARAHVIDAVQRWVFDGHLRNGEVISQDDLGDVLGVSRIPVRDGLLALEATGWVRIDTGGGARAIGLDAAAIRDNFDLIGHLWGLLLRRGLERGADPSALQAAGLAARQATTPEEMWRASSAFRRAMSAFASAPRIEAAFRSIGAIVPGGRIFSVVPETMKVQRRFLPRIVRAVVDGEPEACSETVLVMNGHHARAVIALLEERGVLMRAGERAA